MVPSYLFGVKFPVRNVRKHKFHFFGLWLFSQITLQFSVGMSEDMKIKITKWLKICNVQEKSLSINQSTDIISFELNNEIFCIFLIGGLN